MKDVHLSVYGNPAQLSLYGDGEPEKRVSKPNQVVVTSA
jgi:hypothetical protein